MRPAFFCEVAFALILIVATPAIADDPPIDVPISEIGKQFRLIGELGWPIDQMIAVQGVVVDVQSKSIDEGPNLRPQMIQGVATQDDIQIQLTRYGKERLESGQTYEVEGFEQIAYVGMHKELEDRNRPVQSVSRCLHNHFVVISIRRIDPITLHPGQFENCDGLFQGVATNSDGKSLMVADGWAVVVSADEAWHDDVVGNQVETFGQYRLLGTSRTGRDIYELTSGTWRLVDLADQIGQNIELRGYPLKKSNDWLFVYRGTPILLEGVSESAEWNGDLNGEPTLIRGILEALSPPRPVAGGYLNASYVVRGPVRESIDSLLGLESLPLDYEKWRSAPPSTVNPRELP
jgi:hypothetical protein